MFDIFLFFLVFDADKMGVTAGYAWGIPKEIVILITHCYVLTFSHGLMANKRSKANVQS